MNYKVNTIVDIYIILQLQKSFPNNFPLQDNTETSQQALLPSLPASFFSISPL